MARVHVWKFIINSETGTPIEAADVTVYLAGSNTPAYVYFNEFGGVASNATPQMITRKNGYFEFWVADDSEDNGYPVGQKFKLKWKKQGIVEATIDYIDIFPKIQQSSPVDETDFYSTTKNKLVSNRLAFKWEDHINKDLIQGDPLPIHGIEAVDVSLADDFSNKLVSNVLAKGWEDHKNYTFNSSLSAAHGMEEVDETSSDPTKNKLISNELTKKVVDHSDLYYDELPHGIQRYTDGSEDPIKNKLVSDWVMKFILDHLGTTAYRYETSVTSASWNLAGADGFYKDVDHSLDSQGFPIVDVWSEDTNEKIYLNKVIRVDDNTLRFVSPVRLNIRIKITA